MGKRTNFIKHRIVKALRTTEILYPQQKSVTVYTPSYPGPKVLTMESLLAMTSSFQAFRPDYFCRLELSGGAYLALMRNIAIVRMWEDEKQEGLLLVDHDAVWPTVLPKHERGIHDNGFNALDRVMSLNKDIVGGLFTTRTMPVNLMCGYFDKSTGGLTWLEDVAKGHPLNGTPFEVDWIGCHFLYISRRAVQKMYEHIGSYKTLFDCGSRLMVDGRYNVPLDAALEQYRSGELTLEQVKLTIESLVDKAGFFQEDVSFCRRAKAAGCEIWVDPLFEIQHIGDYSYGRLDWVASRMDKPKLEGPPPGEPRIEEVPRMKLAEG